MNLEFVKRHIRSRPYMSGVVRSVERTDDTEEVFTPTKIAIESLDLLELSSPDCFKDPKNTFLDNSCGDGQLLGEVLIRKMEYGSDFETALSTIYGVELMEDNVRKCRDHLLCGREDLRHIVETNIVCHDALTYHYNFDNSTSTSHLEQLNLPIPSNTKKARAPKTKDPLPDPNVEASLFG